MPSIISPLKLLRLNREDRGSTFLRNVNELHILADSNIHGVFMLMSVYKGHYNPISVSGDRKWKAMRMSTTIGDISHMSLEHIRKKLGFPLTFPEKINSFWGMWAIRLSGFSDYQLIRALALGNWCRFSISWQLHWRGSKPGSGC
jgi:hypothetical protein